MKIKLSNLRSLIREVILEDTQLKSSSGWDGRIDGQARSGPDIVREPGLGLPGLAIAGAAAAGAEVGELIDSSKTYAYPVPVGRAGHGTYLSTRNRAGSDSRPSHGGDDWQVAANTAVLSVGNGTVTAIDENGWAEEPDGTRKKTNCGGMITLQIDGLGPVIYCHLNSVSVSVGDAVTPGMIIGLSGGARSSSTSGRSTGPHLHFSLNQSTDVSIYNALYDNSSGYTGTANPAAGRGTASLGIDPTRPF